MGRIRSMASPLPVKGLGICVVAADPRISKTPALDALPYRSRLSVLALPDAQRSPPCPQSVISLLSVGPVTPEWDCSRSRRGRHLTHSPRRGRPPLRTAFAAAGRPLEICLNTGNTDPVTDVLRHVCQVSRMDRPCPTSSWLKTNTSSRT